MDFGTGIASVAHAYSFGKLTVSVNGIVDDSVRGLGVRALAAYVCIMVFTYLCVRAPMLNNPYLLAGYFALAYIISLDIVAYRHPADVADGEADEGEDSLSSRAGQLTGCSFVVAILLNGDPMRNERLMPLVYMALAIVTAAVVPSIAARKNKLNESFMKIQKASLSLSGALLTMVLLHLGETYASTRT